VDLLCYEEGADAAIPNVSIHRIAVPGITGVGPGISIKKLICDAAFAWRAFQMVWRSRHEPYAVVHAVEESVFIALVIKWCFGIPYIYDMDSSLALQLTEKWWLLKPLAPFLRFFEKLAVRKSVAVVPVCDALAVIADRHGAPDAQVLSDVSLLNLAQATPASIVLRKEAEIPEEALVALYIGNLESYQGIDLLIEGFAAAGSALKYTYLVVIGGQENHIVSYRGVAERLGISDRVRFLGPRPLSTLNGYLTQADILLSPRTKGNNTPMKIYSYLHSGVPMVATRLPTHTQVMDDSVAVLTAPTPVEFGAGIVQLVVDRARREELGRAAFELAERKYTFSVFQRTLSDIYQRVGARLLSRQNQLSVPENRRAASGEE
jgi:glycosyltransferase involved in cell wall biosynthesis